MKTSPAELTGATRRFTLFDANRERIAGFATPSPNAIERAVVVDGLTVGWLALTPFESVSSGAEKRFADAQARVAWGVGGGALLLAAGIAFWASRRLLRPVARVAEATHRLAAGAYETRVPETTRSDEIGRLGRDFNQLAHTLQRNEAMRREFMADVSHELRTPLGVLHGELEALEDGVRQLDAAQLASLQGEVATLHKLVDDLYELSLADVGALAYRKAELDLRDVIDSTAGAFGERIAGSGLQLQLELPSEPLPAFGDERRLRQLFNNLFENSCRYTDAGGALQVKARQEGRSAVIDVLDSGPGVSGEQLPRLFERFFRGEGQPQPQEWRCGAGPVDLSAHRRSAWRVASRPGHRRSAACGCAWNCPVAEALQLEPGPARLLIVEDEPKLAALLADYLRAAGHETETLADGRDVLPAFAARRHELILLDLMLPGIDGLSLCRSLRAQSSVPIVMLTARADEADRLMGLELGADDYIAKNPFSPREVVARVKAVLRRSRASAAPLPSPLQIDEAGWRASWQGALLDLTPIEFRLLRALASQPRPRVRAGAAA